MLFSNIHVCLKMKDINLSQYAKMYLVYVQVARPFTTWNKQASLVEYIKTSLVY